MSMITGSFIISLVGDKKEVVKLINTIYYNLGVEDKVDISEGIEHVRERIDNLNEQGVNRDQLVNVNKHFPIISIDGHTNSEPKDRERNPYDNKIWFRDLKELSSGEWVISMAENNINYSKYRWEDIIWSYDFRTAIIDDLTEEIFHAFEFFSFERTYILEKSENGYSWHMYPFNPDKLINGDVFPIHFGLLGYDVSMNEVCWYEYLLEGTDPDQGGEDMERLLKEKKESEEWLNSLKERISIATGIPNDENMRSVLEDREFEM